MISLLYFEKKIKKVKNPIDKRICLCYNNTRAERKHNKQICGYGGIGSVFAEAPTVSDEARRKWCSGRQMRAVAKRASGTANCHA